jgi:diaminopimelate epimerase
MDFTKLQGAANDFVLIEAEGTQRDWSKLALAICDRHLGVGADSLLLLLPSDKADFLMRTFDADGSEAETCGNGIRCLARYVLEKGKVDAERTEIMVETAAGISHVKTEIKNGRVYRFRANMGKPRFKADEIPVAPEKMVGDIVDITGMLRCNTTVNGIALKLNLISMGNPHAVHFIEQPVAEFPLTEIGPLVEHLPLFPRRVNFEIAQITGKDRIEARVWERGVGETLACGTGACAVAVAARILGYTGRRVEIELLGGVLDAEWNGDGEVILGGPADIVFEGTWPD